MYKARLILLSVLLFTVTALVAQNREEAGSAAPGAQSWTGILADAACKSATPASECEVSTATSSFGLITSDGKFLKFDAAGNSKARSEVQKSKKSGKVSVSVSGAMDGTDTIRVENLSIS